MPWASVTNRFSVEIFRIKNTPKFVIITNQKHVFVFPQTAEHL